jgi:hypothetical protein
LIHESAAFPETKRQYRRPEESKTWNHCQKLRFAGDESNTTSPALIQSCFVRSLEGL